eukprot:TRINITY_DN298_c0_g1_i10.p1 TRINITY_DN298_c0_g1~~TRINITY_DN298_c0_g1_i10.p1  ORF type:complete len:2722 (+),score=563.44 TRINITY_DN298_c0_g1_i10:139-8304(+)
MMRAAFSLSVLLQLAAGQHTTDGLVMYVDTSDELSYKSGDAKWTDLANGNDVTMTGTGWGSIWRDSEKYFDFDAGQISNVLTAKTPFDMGVIGTDWTIETVFSPDTPHQGFRSLLSCVKDDGGVAADIFQLHMATDSIGRTFIDFSSAGFPVSTSAADGYPHIFVGKYETVQIAVTVRLDNGNYEVCAYQNGVKLPCSMVTGSDHDTIDSFNIAKCESFVLNQEQDSVGGGYNIQESYQGRLQLVRVYSKALTSDEMANNFQQANQHFGVCRSNLELYHDAGLTSSYVGCSPVCSTVLKDISGNGRDATVHGDSHWEPYHNGVFDFPDTDYPKTDYIELNGDALAALVAGGKDGSYTLEMVLSSAATPGSHHVSNIVDPSGSELFSLASGGYGAGTTTDSRQCEAGWSYYDTHCYKVVFTPLSFDAAEADCGSLNQGNAHLTSITSKAEYTFVRNLASAANLPEFWLGAKRDSVPSSYFHFVDSEPLSSMGYFPIIPRGTAVQSSGIVAEWDFTQISDPANACPTSGGQPSMCLKTWSGTTVASIGPSGLYLDGTAAVLAPIAADISERTIEVWVKGTEGMRSYDQGIFSFSNGETGAVLFDGIAPGENDGMSWAPVENIFYPTSSHANGRADVGGGAISNTEWTHLVAVYSSSGAVTIYQNGNPYGVTALVDVRTFGTDKFFSLGRRSSNDNSAKLFKGIFNKVTIWDRALTAADVNDRYTASQGFFTDSPTELCSKTTDVNLPSGVGGETVSPSVFVADCGVALPYVCKEPSRDLAFHVEPNLAQSETPYNDHESMQIGVQYNHITGETRMIKNGVLGQPFLASIPLHTAAKNGWMWNARQDQAPSSFGDPENFHGQLATIRLYSSLLDEHCLKKNWDADRQRFGAVSRGLLAHYDARDSTSWPKSGSTWIDISGGGHLATVSSPVLWSENHGGCFSSVITLDPAPLSSITSSTGYTVEYRFAPVLESGKSNPFNEMSDVLWFDADGATSSIRVMVGNMVLNPLLDQPFTSNEVFQFGFAVTPSGQAFTYKNGVSGTVVDLGSVPDISKATSWSANKLTAPPAGVTETDFKGCIIDVKLYDHALTYNEIDQNFGECESCVSDTCECNLCDSDCSSCLDGWIGGPNSDCKLRCDSSSCSDHGTGVPNAMPTVAATECSCLCSGQWTGSRCETCPPQFDQATCESCAPGLFDFPLCKSCGNSCLNGGTGVFSGVSSGEVVFPFADHEMTETFTTTAVTVDIDEGYEPGQDILTYTGTEPLVSSWDEEGGVLTLSLSSGTQPASYFQNVIRQVSYSTSSSSKTAREVLFTYGNAVHIKASGHLYQYYEARGIGWHAAKLQCESKQLNGYTGYLATITSADENNHIKNKLHANGWIGATDESAEGTWRWVTGPEGTEEGGFGRQFWNGAASGTQVNNQYTNWNTNEPDDNVATGEDCLHFLGSISEGTRQGKWNDLKADNPTPEIQGYICEFGRDDETPVPGSWKNQTWVFGECGCQCLAGFAGDFCESCETPFDTALTRADINPALYPATSSMSAAECSALEKPGKACFSDTYRGIHLPSFCPADDCDTTDTRVSEISFEVSFRFFGDTGTQPLIGITSPSPSVGYPMIRAYVKFVNKVGTIQITFDGVTGTVFGHPPFELSTGIIPGKKYFLTITYNTNRKFAMAPSSPYLCGYVNGVLDKCMNGVTNEKASLGGVIVGSTPGTDSEYVLLGDSNGALADGEITDFAIHSEELLSSNIRKSDDELLTPGQQNLLTWLRDEHVSDGTPLDWKCGEPLTTSPPKNVNCNYGWKDGTADTQKLDWLVDKSGNKRHAFIVGGIVQSAQTCSICPVYKRQSATCSEDCDSSLCNGNGEPVRVSHGCECQCNNMWSFDKTSTLTREEMDKADLCLTCFSPYDPAQDCAECLPGYTGYPACNMCEGNTTHCAHGTPSTVNGQCVCTCEDQWTGDLCDICDVIYTGSTADKCDTCNTGYFGYPTCASCDVEYCNNRGVGSVVNDVCVCSCNEAFSGGQCEICNSTKYIFETREASLASASDNQGLQLLLDSDHYTGTGDWEDESGYHHGVDMSAATSPVFVPSSPTEKSHFVFDGTKTASITDLHFDNVGKLHSLSVAIYFRTSKKCAGNFCNGALVDFGSNEWFTIFVNGQGNVCFTTTGAGDIGSELCGTTDCATGSWKYAVIEFEAATSTKRILIDGTSDAQDTNKHVAGIGLGNQQFGTIGSVGTTNFFTGDISKILIYVHQHGSLKLLLDVANYDSSGVWKDVSGQGHHGDIASPFMTFGLPTYVPSSAAPATLLNPPCFQFTGTEIIPLRNFVLPDTSSQIQTVTVAVHFRTTQVCSGTYCNFALFDVDTTQYLGVYVEGDGRLTFTTSGLDVSRRALSTTVKVNDGNWHWLVVSFDAATLKKRMFVDGFIQAEQSGVHSMGIGTGFLSDGYVGGGSMMGYFNEGRTFNGQIGKVAVYTGIAQTRETDHCDVCVESRFGFPDCELCDAAYCNYHGIPQLSADQSSCSCICDSNTNWQGGRCETCEPPAKDPAVHGGNCDECEYDGQFVRNDPTACFQCTIQDHCSNHADQVVADATNTGCLCSCSNRWSGSDCSVCGSEYAASPPGECNECAVGFVNVASTGLPTCTACTIATHCSGNANSVTSAGGLATQCDCDCSNKWSSSDCSVCATGYDPASDCATCDVGYVSVSPLTVNCVQCDIATDCGGNAHSVTTTPDRTARHSD